jgi:hypothetical protein
VEATVAADFVEETATAGEAAAGAGDSTTSDFLTPNTALIFPLASSEAAVAAASSSLDFSSPDTALIFSQHYLKFYT